jgi:hypothetical protein
VVARIGVPAALHAVCVEAATAEVARGRCTAGVP